MIVDGENYGIIGHKSWKALVDGGKLKAEDAVAPAISSVDWLSGIITAIAIFLPSRSLLSCRPLLDS